MFVRSLREANLDLFVATLEKLCPLLFALDHVHYSRWVPVFVHDLKMLKVSDPSLFNEFSKGYFTTKKSNSYFNKMGYDQIHEQTNKIIKSNAGFSQLFNQEDTEYLKKLENVIPEINNFLECAENQVVRFKKHKEEMESFVLRYVSDCCKTYSTFADNPFTQEYPAKVNNGYPMPESVIADMKRVYTLGTTLYSEYKLSRFVFCSEDVVKTSITRNSLKLPRDAKQMLTVDSPQIKILTATAIKLRSACSHRREVALALFKTEFTGKYIYQFLSQS